MTREEATVDYLLAALPKMDRQLTPLLCADLCSLLPLCGVERQAEFTVRLLAHLGQRFPKPLRATLDALRGDWFQETVTSSASERVPTRVDLALVVPKPVEQKAALAVIGLPPTGQLRLRGRLIREFDMPSRRSSETIRVVLLMIGRERNVPSCNATRTLLQAYRPTLCLLVGMAAGVRSRTSLGEVVIASSIVDYEGRRIEQRRSRRRPEEYRISPALEDVVAQFVASDENWRADAMQRLGQVHPSYLEAQDAEAFRAAVGTGVIVSGEGLVARGGFIESFRTSLHERTRALEMEGSGFAQACREEGAEWLVVRGIADFGDPESKDAVQDTSSRKKWQLPAAVLATHAALWVAEDFLAATNGGSGCSASSKL